MGSTRGETTPGWRWTTRRTAALVAVAAVVVGGVVWAVSRDAKVDDRLFVLDAAGAISLVDPASGATMFRVPGATATPDRSALLTTEDVDGRTVLSSHDPADGTVTGSTTLPRQGLTVRTVSPQGLAVALMPGPRGSGIYEPEPRERTELVVSFLDDREPLTFDLDGNVEPEMFSYDESGLFVIEFVPPTAPDSYFVRRLDLETGELTDTGAPQVGLNPRMRGKARASVLHPAGEQLLTLYTLPEGVDPFDGEEHHGSHDGPLRAFVHVIDLEDDVSFCIFLPVPIGTVEESTVGMGISPDGSRAYVVDAATSTIATIDTASLEVVGTTSVVRLRSDFGAQAKVAVAGDGTLYVGSGTVLLEIGAPDLVVTRVWSQRAPIEAVSLSARDDQVRVGAGGRIAFLDRASGLETGVLEPPGEGVVALLGPPQGSVTQFPLECAC